MYSFKEFISEGINTPTSPAKIISVLNSTKKSFIGKTFTPSKFKSLLQKTLNKTGVDVLVSLEKDKENIIGEPNIVVISGFYDSMEDEDEETPFEIVVVYDKRGKIVVDEECWGHISKEIPEVLTHEIHHSYQARRRDFNPASDKSKMYKTSDAQYLGNDDEIEAYANDIAKNMLVMNKYAKAMSLLKRGNVDVPIFQDYIKEFGKAHKVTKKLTKKIIQFLNHYNEK